MGAGWGIVPGNLLKWAGLAQLAEQLICNQQVIGSNPIAGSIVQTDRMGIMKYMLDIALIVGLLWIGYLWNGEKKTGLAMSDQIDELNAKAAQLSLDLSQAKDSGAKTAAELEGTKAQLSQTAQDLKAKSDALSAKEAEAEELRNVGLKLKARVAELEGYKQKAIVAEMPKPIGQ